jgi:VWFA-related protein
MNRWIMKKRSTNKARVALLCASLVLLFQTSLICGFGQEQTRPARADDPVKLNSTLVQVPAIVTDRAGALVTDLSQKEFAIFEDGKRQEISLFAALKQPFHAVLVLDTSNTAEDRLRAIQNSAIAFSREIEPADRLMVISFDNEIRRLTDFTSDRAEIEAAVNAAQSGFGKLLYESVDRALEELKDVEGRRAVILFSDGVDLGSVGASAETTIRRAEEIGAVIYVVRFDTRWWIESAVRKQKAEHPQSKLPFEVDGRIPLPPDYGGPDPSGVPGTKRPRIEVNSRPTPPVIIVNGRRQEPEAGPVDEIAESFDKLYGEADKYTQSLSSLSGGVVFRAENFNETQSAFRAIAEELRKQYLIGYYLANDSRNGKYRKVKVEVSRKGVQVRARPGYRR